MTPEEGSDGVPIGGGRVGRQPRSTHQFVRRDRRRPVRTRAVRHHFSAVCFTGSDCDGERRSILLLTAREIGERVHAHSGRLSYVA